MPENNTVTANLVPRHGIVSYYGVPSSEANGTVTHHRMKYFTEGGISKNPKERTSKYLDEANERTQITGYSPSMSYGFDRHVGDPVHEDIIDITNKELIGGNAVRKLTIVDFTRKVEGPGNNYYALQRSNTVVPDTEGDDPETYTHSGNFRANGELVEGYVESSDNWQTVNFVANVSPDEANVTPPEA